MPHNIDVILTLTAGLTAAMVLGFITQKLKLSPIVGYLIAGILISPNTGGFKANQDIAYQFSEIGVILLMFGVGLHFHLKDLMAVRKIAIPGAIAQIAAATLLGGVVAHFFGWSWTNGFIFGMAISVASTVVLTRVLADNRDLHTPSGHIAIGWLIVEDLFTILVLVLLPAIYGPRDEGSNVWGALGISMVKLTVLVVLTLVVGQKLIPKFLGYVAKTKSRELFTLTVLVLALGFAVGSAKFFDASMALGAFLVGMVVGQSEYNARAATESMPMKDAFAVLFFVSVGMLFDPSSLKDGWPLMLATLAVVIIGKPIAALLVVKFFGRSWKSALSISVALAQIGEFSFILAALAISLKVMPQEATNALVVASVLSITLNPMLYKAIDPSLRWLEKKGWIKPEKVQDSTEPAKLDDAAHRVILVGYGPVGQTLSRIFRDTGIQVVVIEMNIDTVQALRAQGLPVLYGDAAQREILHHAGIEKAEGLIIAASSVEAREVVAVARELNPKIRILARTTYLREAEALRRLGVNEVFSGEGEIAISMTDFLMEQLGASAEHIDRERDRIRSEFRQAPAPLPTTGTVAAPMA